MTSRPRFKRRDASEATVLRSWHGSLLSKSRRGDRAQLRLASTIEEVAMAPAFHDLLRRLGLTPAAGHDLDIHLLGELAAVAALVAQVDQQFDEGTHIDLGSTLAQARQGSSSPRVSAARFRRLLASMELQERFTVLRRLLPLVDRSVDPVEIAGAICDWSPTRRRRLAYDYYANAPLTHEETRS